MPYIKQERRDAIFSLSTTDYDSELRTSGELNYFLTVTINDYIQNNGLSYSTINDILGALEGAKLEFYRRVVAPYENSKIKENGDVYK